MDRQRRLMLVEDVSVQFQGLKVEFEATGWSILHALDGEAALRVFDQSLVEAQPVDVAALDLGLPPGKDNPLRAGLPLAEALRERDAELPILAYTSLSSKAVDFSLLLARLLPLRISFVSLRQLGHEVRLAQLLELVWSGFILQSPATADYLPKAVAARPDPLEGQQWETLRLLSQDLTQVEIAKRMGLSKDGVKARLRKISEVLVEAGELESFQTERQDLVTWYKLSHVRYRRR